PGFASLRGRLGDPADAGARRHAGVDSDRARAIAGRFRIAERCHSSATCAHEDGYGARYCQATRLRSRQGAAAPRRRIAEGGGRVKKKMPRTTERCPRNDKLRQSSRPKRVLSRAKRVLSGAKELLLIFSCFSTLQLGLSMRDPPC